MALAYGSLGSMPLADIDDESEVTEATEPALVYGSGAAPVAILIEVDNISGVT